MNLSLSGNDDGIRLESVQRAKRTKKLTAAELFLGWDHGDYHAPDDCPSKGDEIDWDVLAGKEAWR